MSSSTASGVRSSWRSLFRRKERAVKADNDDLFDDEFQRKLEYLSVVSRRVFAGRLRAERRTKKSGSGVEFADHREYQPGDDFRYLDWNVYQRFGRLLVRLYEEEEDLAIYLILDTSGSMASGAERGRDKLRYAKKVVAALAYVGLANLDRVSIVTTSDRVMERMQETRGKARIFKAFRFLRTLEAEGTTDLGDAMKTFVAQNKRRGLAVLVSDLYDPRGFERGVNLLRYNKFDPFVVHVVDPADAKPNLARRCAPLRLRDGRRARGDGDGEGPRALRRRVRRVPLGGRAVLYDAPGPLRGREPRGPVR